MSEQDRRKWEKKHRSGELSYTCADDFLVKNRNLLRGGRGLDIAAGMGANALYLARCGYAVTAIDISFVAMQALMNKARQSELDISCIVADLDSFFLPSSYYDLVIVFYFYLPELTPYINRALAPGGILIYATYNERHLGVRPHFNAEFLVKTGALQRAFSDLHVISVHEQAGPAHNISRFIGRKAL